MISSNDADLVQRVYILTLESNVPMDSLVFPFNLTLRSS